MAHSTVLDRPAGEAFRELLFARARALVAAVDRAGRGRALPTVIVGLDAARRLIVLARPHWRRALRRRCDRLSAELGAVAQRLSGGAAGAAEKRLRRRLCVLTKVLRDFADALRHEPTMRRRDAAVPPPRRLRDVLPEALWRGYGGVRRFAPFTRLVPAQARALLDELRALHAAVVALGSGRATDGLEAPLERAESAVVAVVADGAARGAGDARRLTAVCRPLTDAAFRRRLAEHCAAL